LYLWNGSSFVFEAALNPNAVFDFAPGGVSEFEILGIDPKLALDPSNPTAFLTYVTFENAGPFTGTMQPITTELNGVPELSSWAMMALGFVCVNGIRGRIRNRSSTLVPLRKPGR
jgi:hypothetical protein